MNRAKCLKVSIILTFLICLLSINAFADRGVFNAKVTPDEILTNAPTTVTVTAEVGAENLYISSVAAYEVDATGKPIAYLCRMYDDGSHGDETEADTIFTCQYSINKSASAKTYVRVTAAYRGDRNRYLSSVMELAIYPPLPTGLVDQVTNTVQTIQNNFYEDIITIGLEGARQQALMDALNNPNIGAGNASLSGTNLSIMYDYLDPSSGYTFKIPGIIFLVDPNNLTDAAGRSVPTNLPTNYKSPGNDKLLIFAPGYNNADPQRGIADHAQSQFNNTEYMTFNPTPPVITPDASASLELIKQWGDYGTVIMHTHGGLWSLNGVNQVVLLSGTPATLGNQLIYIFDLIANRIGIAGDGRFVIYPSFITKHASSMKNTFFYLGACESLQNDTMWNALRAKGAKVAFGWSETVNRQFNTDTFARLIDPMLPHSTAQNPQTAKQAFDNVTPKTDPWGGHNATLTMRTASSEWEQFVFAEGGIINGDFETGDWTGWTHGGDYDYRIISGARKHGGNNSAALGRWDTAYHGYDPTSEPYGYEWFYQDFVVPSNATYLKFNWWMETYDTAIWDWFDAYIQDTIGNTLRTLLSHAGKPGSNYGPYWTTQMAYGGDGWQEAVVDISAYRGQKIRIYFDQRLDGFGDQQRTYIDDVRLE